MMSCTRRVAQSVLHNWVEHIFSFLMYWSYSSPVMTFGRSSSQFRSMRPLRIKMETVRNPLTPYC